MDKPIKGPETTPGNLFGLPTTREQANIIILPVPWEVTTSYGGGTSRGPEAIKQASPQLDLFHPKLGKIEKAGFYMEEVQEETLKLNDELKKQAQSVIKRLEQAEELTEADLNSLKVINRASEQLTNRVFEESRSVLSAGKTVGIVGGDHSVPLGLMRALLEVHGTDLGVLHIDAHADLREAYEGFEQSHASIMFNLMNQKTKPQRLVQVGIRDFSEEENQLIQRSNAINCFFDSHLKEQLFKGQSWHDLCQEIISQLPDKVYLSFDIDGLSPALCPHTGTPVPGGLSFEQATYLIESISVSGRKIVGFDLCEVSPSPHPEDEWDGNVGARILFELCVWCAQSQGLL